MANRIKRELEESGGNMGPADAVSRDSGAGWRIVASHHLSFSSRFRLLFSLRRIPKVGQVERRKLRLNRQGAILLVLQAVKHRGYDVIIRVHKTGR